MERKNQISDELLKAIQKLDKGLALKSPGGHSTLGFLLGTIYKVCDEQTHRAIIDDICREISLYSGGEDLLLEE